MKKHQLKILYAQVKNTPVVTVINFFEKAAIYKQFKLPICGCSTM